jgi:ADP-heptose:LPS heptosyltransferase
MAHSSPSVLAIRLDAIGDALALTPLLAALRDRSVPVDIVLRSSNARIFSDRAARATYIAPFALRSRTPANLAAISSFARELAPNAYTHILVATEDPGGYELAARIPAAAKIGFANGWGKPFKTLWVRTKISQTVFRSAGLDARAPHECEVMFSLGRSLLDAGTVPSREPSRLRPLVIDRDVTHANRVVFQVSDKWERLGIAFTDVAAALTSLRERHAVHAIASESETLYARRMSDACGIAVERFAEIEPWKSAIAGAAALVAPDSGAVHVAGMVGTPTVAVFPPIRDFALQIARWSPWAAPYQIVRADAGWPARIAPAVHELLAD